MADARFCRYVFRTTAVDEARAFYDAVLGGVGDGVVELAAAAVARGARPHWLGVIDVSARGTAEDVAARFIERGATRLGPPGNAEIAVLRDAGGAIVALSHHGANTRAEIGWHQLHTANAPQAARIYGDLLGWVAGDERDLGTLGKMRPLAWGPDDAAAQAPRAGITGIEDRPELHAHWWFFFVVPSMEKAIGEALARGAKIVGPDDAARWGSRRRMRRPAGRRLRAPRARRPPVAGSAYVSQQGFGVGGQTIEFDNDEGHVKLRFVITRN